MPKASVTLEMILAEIKRSELNLRAEIKESQQELRSEIHASRSEFRAEITGIRKDLVRIEKKLDATYQQVGKVTEKMAALEKRVSKLEGPSA